MPDEPRLLRNSIPGSRVTPHAIQNPFQAEFKPHDSTCWALEVIHGNGPGRGWGRRAGWGVADRVGLGRAGWGGGVAGRVGALGGGPGGAGGGVYVHTARRGVCMAE